MAVLILTTGRVDRDSLELFVSDDIFAVFPKPFDIQQILKSLDEAVEFAKSGSRVAARLHGFLEKFNDR